MSVAAGHSQSAIPGARFMDPSVLARIGNLELVSRAVVDGFINGMHKAPYFGASVDFAEHRGYVPGDDLRRRDWKLWARTDRDYVEEADAVLDAISPLRFRGNDLIVFHILDKSELEFGFTDASAFEDMESGDQMPVVPDAFRKEYQSLVKAHLDALQQRFSANRIDYTVLDTSKPLDHALYRYLSSRARMMKVR